MLCFASLWLRYSDDDTCQSIMLPCFKNPGTDVYCLENSLWHAILQGVCALLWLRIHVGKGKVSRVTKYQSDVREEVAPNRRETYTGSKPCERDSWGQQSHKEVRAKEI